MSKFVIFLYVCLKQMGFSIGIMASHKYFMKGCG